MITPFRSKTSRPVFVALALTGAATFSPPVEAQPFPENYLVERAPVMRNPATDQGFAEVVSIDDGHMVVSEGAALHFYDFIDGTWTNRGRLNVLGATTWYDADLRGNQLAIGRATGNGEVMVFEQQGDRDDALNAWNTTDNLTTAPKYAYGRTLTPAEHTLANTEGWTLTIRARMVNDFGGVWSCYLDFANNSSQRFLITFDLNSAGNLVVELAGHEIITIPSDGTGWARYHTHQIVFDPGTGTAGYFFDGEQKNASPWSPAAVAGLNGLRFGTGSTAGRGSVNWNQIEFKTAQTQQVLALYDAGTIGNSPASLNPVDQGWVALDTTGTSAGPVAGDYNSWWIAKARFVPYMLPTQFSLADSFGFDVELRDDTLFVGYPSDVDGSANAGSVRIFRRVNDEWIEPPMPGMPGFPEMLVTNPRVWYREFGYTLDVDGDTLIVGSRGFRSVYNGQAHVYLEDAGIWELQAELMSVGQLPGFNELSAVAIKGDLAVVGTHQPAQETSGIAQVYRRQGTTWSKVANLVPNPTTIEGIHIEQFVRAVIGNGFIIVAYFDDSNFVVSHAVFVEDATGNWVQAEYREYVDPRNGSEQFGWFSDADFDGEHFVTAVASGEGEGETVHIFQTYHHDVPALTEFVNELLYYPAAQNSGSPFIDANDAAFRYLHLLYERDLVNGVNPVYDQIGDHFGQAEHDRASYAELQLLKGLMLNPGAPELRVLLLDLFHDLARANNVVTRDLLERAQRAHFGLPIGEPTPSSGFIIDAEIPLYQSVLDGNRAALDDYFRLFETGDYLPGQPPIGYASFRDLVPARGLMSAEFVDDTNGGQIESVFDTGTELLFSGFKDAVTMFEMLRDHGRISSDLARLLISRDKPPGPGTPSDRARARALISSTTAYLLNHGNLVKGMFATLPPLGDQSGLAETIEAWEGALSDLHGLEPIADSSQNILGFSDDFHFFIENFGSSAPPELQFFHSFDIFKERLKPGVPTSQLELSIQELLSAEGSYAGYRGTEDQVAAEFNESTITYRDRLRDIVGVFPEDPKYADVPALTNFPGSLIDEQRRSIELAKNRILRNSTEVSNLLEEVAIERARNNSYSNAVIDFGSRQANLTKEIGNIKATQAAAQAMADGLSIEDIVTGQFIGLIANAAVQGGGEVMIASREAEKEELAATEQATLEGVNSEARIKTLLLGLKTLAVDSTEQQLLLVQEVNRLADIYREKDDLERKMREKNVSLSRRYFADPVHRLIYQADMESADLLFGEAQRWLFFMVKAYEYKHNVALNVEYPGGSGVIWGSATVFKCRNAEELRNLYQAMSSRDQLLNLGDRLDPDSISLRKDYFGYVEQDSLGNPLSYPDPITGNLVGAVEAFRSRLKISTNLNTVGPNTIHLEFSTVRKFAGAPFFFLGPEFDDAGNLVNNDAGRYIDKIKTMRISMPGTHRFGFSSLPGNLTYGGTSFIRKERVGIPDPAEPNKLVGEFTAYSTRYWFIDSQSATERWTFVESRRINGVPIDIVPVGSPAPTVGNIEEFKERSVATSRWELDIPLFAGSTQRLDINEINDIILHVWHFSKSRVQ